MENSVNYSTYYNVVLLQNTSRFWF